MTAAFKFIISTRKSCFRYYVRAHKQGIGYTQRKKGRPKKKEKKRKRKGGAQLDTSMINKTKQVDLRHNGHSISNW